MALDIELDTRRVRRFLTQAQRRCLPRATRRALNTTLRGVTRTDAPREIQKNLNLPKRPITRRLRFRVSRTQGMFNSSLFARLDTLHLTDFKGTRQNRRGVAYKVSTSGGRELLKSAFIQKGRGQGAKNIVFRRVRGNTASGLVGRYPIKARKGPSIGSQISRNHKVRARIVERAQERWSTEWPRSLNYEFNVRRCGR